MSGSGDVISVEDFRTEAIAFLDAHATPKPAVQVFEWGRGSDDVAVFDEKDREAEAAEAEVSKEWRRSRFDNGFGWISGPEKFGGAGLTAAHARAYDSLESGYETPNMGVFAISLGMVAPTILAHATPEVQDLYLRDLYRGDRVGCQLFSEPGPGSDLASAPDPRRPRRRRVDPQRSEGLDLAAHTLRHRRDHLPHRSRPAEAQGAHRVRGRHAGPRRRDPAAATDDRRRGVQRGVLHRRARPRRPPPR